MSNLNAILPTYLDSEEKNREFNLLAEYFLTHCDIADGLTQKELVLCIGHLMDADEEFYYRVMIAGMNITLSIMADAMKCRKRDKKEKKHELRRRIRK